MLIHVSCYHVLKIQIIHFNRYTFLFYENNHVYKKSIQTNSFFLLSFFEVTNNSFNLYTFLFYEKNRVYKKSIHTNSFFLLSFF